MCFMVSPIVSSLIRHSLTVLSLPPYGISTCYMVTVLTQNTTRITNVGAATKGRQNNAPHKIDFKVNICFSYLDTLSVSIGSKLVVSSDRHLYYYPISWLSLWQSKHCSGCPIP